MRISGLDFLRGIAIILVIFRHGGSDNWLTFIGWAGVDLFFVLSGFLVSGLVFKEYKERESVDIKRFLIRRAFKIYPPFYFFILVSIVLFYGSTGGFYTTSQILTEVFYLQSYREGMWLHTWSLAVEEHFYLALAIVIFLCLKGKIIDNVTIMRNGLIACLILTFLLRLQIASQNSDKQIFSFTQTHLRLDGILVGVLASYLYYFTSFYKTFLINKFVNLGAGFLLMSPLLWSAGGSYFMNTVGLTTVNIGFGIVVLFSLKGWSLRFLPLNKILKGPFKLIQFIGIHSYSIYLWHLMSDNIITVLNINLKDSFWLNVVITLMVGISMSYAIERPILKLRDKWYKKPIIQANTEAASI